MPGGARLWSWRRFLLGLGTHATPRQRLRPLCYTAAKQNNQGDLECVSCAAFIVQSIPITMTHGVPCDFGTTIGVPSTVKKFRRSCPDKRSSARMTPDWGFGVHSERGMPARVSAWAERVF